jgi:hypothetical protein
VSADGPRAILAALKRCFADSWYGAAVMVLALPAIFFAPTVRWCVMSVGLANGHGEGGGIGCEWSSLRTLLVSTYGVKPNIAGLLIAVLAVCALSLICPRPTVLASLGVIATLFALNLALGTHSMVYVVDDFLRHYGAGFASAFDWPGEVFGALLLIPGAALWIGAAIAHARAGSRSLRPVLG